MARQLKGPDADLADVLKEIIADEHVPFLAAYRYKPSGLDKRAQWERTWDLQREEDATGKRLDIPVPPKYAGADFQKQSYWRHRGKLDVPKERFISYPGASPDSDYGLPPHRLGRLGPQGPGHRPDRPDRRPQHHRRLGHRPPDPPAGRPPGDHALGPPVAQRDRPSLRPEPRRSLRRLPNHRTRVPQPNRRRPPSLDPTPVPPRSAEVASALARDAREPWGEPGQIRARSGRGQIDWNIDLIPPTRLLTSA